MEVLRFFTGHWAMLTADYWAVLQVCTNVSRLKSKQQIPMVVVCYRDFMSLSLRLKVKVCKVKEPKVKLLSRDRDFDFG